MHVALGYPWSPAIYEGGHGLGFRYKIDIIING